ncbi:T9SS type A sorting domain-containing protein [Tenacibaculum sp. M341]|uniref:T9SS type A sorting domain-containing protein n=1 Tax=Tenacibaculum sp. M341 TaxID=2530339 RepID=UPI00104A506B|nr:T9SS type A sorting domain-containing protein [Tenacibaculum sp. M341]TCI84784.1 hypothetical protein EYW44_19830 [Tenacibaculum sp. M341]
MRTKKIILTTVLLYGLHVKAQEQKDWVCGDPVVGEVNNVHFRNCDKDILITTTKNEGEKETVIGGVIETTKRIIIKPEPGGRVKIIAGIKHVHTKKEDHSHRGIAHRGTKIGSNSGGQSAERILLIERMDDSFELFPNPVKDQLNISIEEEILYYKITDSFGFIYLEGENNYNKIIKTDLLTKGVYNLTIQTKTKIKTKTFYKN